MEYQTFFLLLAILQMASGMPDDDSDGVDLENITFTASELDNGLGVQYRDGDIIIGVLINQYSRNESYTKCGYVNDYGVPFLEVVNMLVDEVNRNNDLLPGVKLGTLALDTCGVDTHAVKMVVRRAFPFFWDSENCTEKDQTFGRRRSPVFAGMIGESYSTVSILVSKVLQVFKIPLISYWSTDTTLSNKNLHPYFFRTVPSDYHQTKAMLQLMNHKGWTYFSTVYEASFYGLQGFREMQELAEMFDICIAYNEAVEKDSKEDVFDRIITELLKEKLRSKVVVVFMGATQAEMLLKAASKSPEARGYFTWIASEGWAEYLPKSNDQSYDLELNHCIGFIPKSRPIDRFHDYFTNLTLEDRFGNNSHINPWFAQFLGKNLQCNVNGTSLNTDSQQWCKPHMRLTDKKFTELSLTQYVADAVLAIVHALHNYHNATCGGQAIVCENITCGAGTNELAVELLPYLKNVTFPAINGGEFEFDENHDGPKPYSLKMFRRTNKTEENNWILIGYIAEGDIVISEDVLFNEAFSAVESVCSKPCEKYQARVMRNKVCCWTCVTCRSKQIVGKNGSACVDCGLMEKSNQFRNECISFPIEDFTYNNPFSIAAMAVSSLGICLAACVILIFYLHRNTPIVKASGKEQCIIIFIGVCLCNINGYVMAGGINYSSCAVSRVMFALGPCAIYAALLSKTIRVVIIFHSKILKPHTKTYIRPKPQIVTTLAMLTVQVFILALWFLIFSVDPVVTKRGTDLFYHECGGGEDGKIFIALVYPFLLIIICTVLATINRNVPTGFNETKFVGFAMYTTCVIWLAFLSIYLSNPTHVQLKIMTTKVCLSLSSTTVLLCLFAPRSYDIVFRPERNTAKSVMNSKHINPGHSRPSLKSYESPSTASPARSSSHKEHSTPEIITKM